MNLKVTLAALAAEKIAEKVKIDDSLNTALNKIGKITGQKTTSEYIQKIEKNCLIIKQKSYSLGTLAGIVAGKMPDLSEQTPIYQVYDSLGEIKYKLHTENVITSREILTLYDNQNNKIGYIIEHLISVGIPLLEKEVKTCSVYLKDRKIAELKKCIFSNELQFEAIEGNIKITVKDDMPFDIYYNNDLSITMHYVPLNLKDGYTDKFVIEYNETTYEPIAILLSIALNLLKS